MLSQNNPVNMFDACHDIIGCLVAAVAITLTLACALVRFRLQLLLGLSL